MIITLNQYKLFTSREYINSLMGLRVAYVTPAGTRVEGTITAHPMTKGSSHLAVTTAEGKWAALGTTDTLELLDA